MRKFLPLKTKAKMNTPMGDQSKPQSDKFKEAARELECDEDEKAWEDRLRKVASQKPQPEKSSD